ncbi:MAG: Na+/H+ antiporter [Gemmatimonadaceae bacterium]|nr:Na+/H+ antiporter [Acetobacteraceae bacterium]
MSPVALFELILLLLAIVIGLEIVARRLQLPRAAALILGGIVLALIPDMPGLELDPELVLVLFLPPLLMSSAFFTSWRDFRANLRIILQLAVGAVVFTTLIVGVVAHWVMPSLPWAACFALGAIVSPPDAVAAKSVLARVNLPPRMTVLLEGESLVNDATGLVLFRFAVAAGLTGAFDAGQAVLSFGVVAVGGIALGTAFGFAIAWILSRLSPPHMAVVGSLLASWAAYIGAEALHVSGVLAVVCSGLVMGWRQHHALDAATRIRAQAVWSVVEFVLESLVFILIGLSLRGVLARLGGTWESVLPLLPAALAIVLATVVSRFVWMIPATYIPRFLVPSLRQRDPYPPLAVPMIMSWAGLRGVVSLAAALALPEEFPGRDFIVATTFLVILVTVLVQGATLAPLVRAFHLGDFTLQRRDTLPEAAARARMAAAQLAALEQHSLADDGSHRHPRLLEQYSYRARAAVRYSEAEGSLVESKNEHFEAVLTAIAAGRSELLRQHRTDEIHDDVLHALEAELDIEEMGARRQRDIE